LIEKYKILGGMLALREFTVEELSLYTGAKRGTISTNIGRYSMFLEEVGREKTGRRGGRIGRWRVKEAHVEALRAQVGSLFLSVRSTPNAIAESESNPEIPNGLLVAEDILLRLYPAANTIEKKQELLQLAELNLDAGRVECENLFAGSTDDGDVEALRAHLDTVRRHLEAHMHSIEELIVLSRLEYDLYNRQEPEPPVDVQSLCRKLKDVSKELYNLGGDLNCDHAFETMLRLADSPVINMALRW
jgi:hypothetical protein